MEITIKTDAAEVRLKVTKSIDEMEDSIADAMGQVAEFGLSRWTDLAQQRLTGDSAATYLTNISAFYKSRGAARDPNEGLIDRIELDRGAKTARLALVGKLSNMLENGFDAFDIAEAIRKKQGRSDVNVPFRHFLPTDDKARESKRVAEAEKVSGGKISRVGRHRGAMPKSVVGHMRGTIRQAEAAGKKRTRGRKYPPAKGSGHRTGIHSDMVSPTKFGGRSQGTGSYKTFRRITQESVWIHPGFTGIHAVEEVKTIVETVGPQILAKFLGEVLEVKIKES